MAKITSIEPAIYPAAQNVGLDLSNPTHVDLFTLTGIKVAGFEERRTFNLNQLAKRRLPQGVLLVLLHEGTRNVRVLRYIRP